MSGSDKTTDAAASAIADALRAKRERKSNTDLDLAALEASLLADIESFDMRALTVNEAAPRPAMLEATRDLGLPTIAPEGARAQKPASAPKLSPAIANPDASTLQPGASLLSQLRQQAESRIQESASQSRQQSELAQMMDEGLRRVFDFFHEFIQQLNIIQPTVARTYSLPGLAEFSGLVWQKGFVDYRTRPYSAGTVFDVVAISFQLKTSRHVYIERDGPAVESLRKILIDSGVVFSCEEKRNNRQMVEKAVFSLAPEVKTTVRWKADFEKGGVVLETRNLERFGDIRYFVPMESLTQAMLDEFGRLVLGQGHRFREFTRR